MRINRQWHWLWVRDFLVVRAIVRLDVMHAALGVDINRRDGIYSFGFGPVELSLKWFDAGER